MSILNRPVTRAAYVIVLNKDDPSPLAPESDDEKEKKELEKKDEKKEEKKDAPKVKVDIEDIDQRTLALPLPPKNYVGLVSGKVGTIFLIEGPAVQSFDDGPGEGGPPPRTVQRFDLEKRKAEKLVDANTFIVSGNGEKMLYRLQDNWFITGTGGPAKPGEGQLKLDSLEVRVDPKAEWKQMYRETYRIQRDFLYDPGFHGYDLKAAWDKHESYLDGIGSRHDLNYLLDELLAGLSLQHVYLGGGDIPRVESRKCGLLGADFAVENGRHRITKVYRGESWNPGLRAPLTQPGAGVKEGEYVLAVNGQDLKGEDEVYRLFEGTAGKQTILRSARTRTARTAER
jgi:tricorn protease